MEGREEARPIVHRMNLIIRIVVPDGLESGRERSLVDLGTGEPVGTSPCRCQLCQSGEGTYDARCGHCDSVIYVVRGRAEAHNTVLDTGLALCPGSGEEHGVITFAVWLPGAVLRTLATILTKTIRIYREG